MIPTNARGESVMDAPAPLEEDYPYISKTNVGWYWKVKIRGRGDKIVRTTSYASVIYNDHDVALQHYIDELVRVQAGAEVIVSEFSYQK